MRIEATIPDHGALVMAIMEGFVIADELIIKAGLVPPSPLMVPGLKFIPESSGSENWKLAHAVLKDGGGDCEDLAFWHAAGLRVTGEDPGAACILVQTGEHDLHCVVLRSDGSQEDPALVLKLQGTRRRRGKPSPPPPPPHTVRELGPPVMVGDLPKPTGVRVKDHRTNPATPAELADYQARLIPTLTNRPLPPKVQAFIERGGTFTRQRGGQASPVDYSTFGKGKRDTSGAGLVLVTDDQDPNQTPFWMRPSQIDQAAWDAGVSPDELRAQLAYADQFSQNPFPDWSADPFVPWVDGLQDFPGFGFGGDPSMFGMWNAAVDPSEFYFNAAEGLGLVDEPSPAEELGIDESEVIDVEGDEFDGDAA